jgi:hypothetical protein
VERDDRKLTQAEIADLLAPHPRPPAARWILPLSVYLREPGDVGFALARFG